MTRKRILTGDRPTGKLHLGHYVGSLKNRVKLQDEYECFFIIADLHTLTTQPEKTGELKENVKQLVLDYLSVGIDPAKATIYLQSQIPEVAELAIIFSNLISVPRLERIPTLKDVMADAHITIPSLGLLGYPVLQAADILMVKANLVPVGKDQASHIEVTREIAREFNRLYPIARGPVSSSPPASARSGGQSGGDQRDQVELRVVGNPSRTATPRLVYPERSRRVFPIPEALIPADIGTLPGTDGKTKMSKSTGNVINLSDDSATVRKKVMGMYTDPKRIHGDEPGDVANNPVFVYLEVFASDSHKSQVISYKEKYKKGAVKDVEVKEFLTEVLEKFLAPIRKKRAEFEKQPELVGKILKEGTEKARLEAQKTLSEVKRVMKLDVF
ncbi:tryptophan--tRNA ligase [Candidatus Curtissbacteria bacterium RIFCSPLOWO2_02_FULL_40_13b]|uniref:Tryptophan--tRNA ligase n=2 Tax=Candidatus Curtissiibacteriota TaxID=1752717 RepID=A0A1F5HXH5_9BACT|nr:MAG: tryptophan--tRNA ligase [Candidatus Curtissbacteria bacterium RIFCSPHIGHO2_01_FULL_40_12]OGE08803.1 MAG: tryptophan--tRNA ligase [Candidatus Curtissbacteria bacterium RIFCSPLOWO2_02_FULL_40_13b]